MSDPSDPALSPAALSAAAEEADFAAASHVSEDQDYGAGQIQVLEGMEAVRKRPAMYIGDTFERGYHHCVYEVVDNSIDEAMAGFCTHVDVTLNADGSCTVRDDGRGIPVDMHPTEHRPAVEVVLTVLHAGGKFGNGGYKVSGGLHGVGVSCVNALSDWLEVEVRRDGKVHRMRFSRGHVTKPLEVVGACPAEETGTTVTFHLDKEIFHDDQGNTYDFKWEILSKRFKELSFLNPGVTINFADENTGKKETYYHKDGIVGFIRSVTKGRPSIEPDPAVRDAKLPCDLAEVISVKGVEDGVSAEIALQYVDEKYDESIFTFANNINTIEGGTHLSGFCSALTGMVNNYARANKLLKESEENLAGEDIREGVVCVISVKVPNPQFEGQTKTKLGNSNVAGIVQRLVGSKLKDYFDQNPKVAQAIVTKAVGSQRARFAARKAREMARNDNKKLGKFLGKLKDCSSRNRDECELFLVEGDSAGGSAMKGRDTRTQAILPLRGKVLNVQKARIDRILANQEIHSLISAIGGGFGNNEFDVSKIRYDKVVIMTDADVDGAHIRTLLLTFFYNQMRPLIEHGHVYIAQPPLYGIKKNKNIEYIESDVKLTARLIALGAEEFSFASADGASKVESRDMPDLLRALAASEDLCNRLVKQNVDIRRYFRERNAAGEFPRFRVLSDTDGNPVETYAFKQSEVDAIKRQTAAALAGLSEPPAEESTDGRAPSRPEGGSGAAEAPEGLAEAAPAASPFAAALASLDEPENPNFTCTEILQAGTLRRNMDTLAELYHLPASAFWGAEGATIGTITDTKGAAVPVASLMDLLEQVRARGRRGLTIQRYKGLGEMDWDQLYDTTMDPARRKMLKVSLDSAVDADKTFSLLMGVEVAPRRNWIETNALMANIDA